MCPVTNCARCGGTSQSSVCEQCKEGYDLTSGGQCSKPMHMSTHYHVRFRDVIWRTNYGKNGEILVFMAAEDSSEGFVKAATRKKVYKCLQVC